MKESMMPKGKVKPYKSPFQKKVGMFTSKVNKASTKKNMSGFKYEPPSF